MKKIKKILVSEESSINENPTPKDIEIDFRGSSRSRKYLEKYDIEKISEGTEEEKSEIYKTIEVDPDKNTDLRFSDLKISKTISEKTQKNFKTEDNLKHSKVIDFNQSSKERMTIQISETEDYSDEFYYISNLKKALELGIEEIKSNIREGKGFTYEYDQENSRNDSQNIVNNKFYNHYHHCIQSVAYLSTLGNYNEEDFLDKRVYLPPKRSKKMKTLILDLDETLVHCSENMDKNYDIKTKIKFTGGEILDCGVNFRPFAPQFLKYISKIYEIVVFTASHSCYANSILNLLDPSNNHITFRIFRDSCLETEENIFVKDLRIFANRKMKNMLIVDNACYSYAGQIENGIPIVPYFEGKEDRELLELAAFLTCLEGKSNFLREVIEKNTTSESLDSDHSEDSRVDFEREEIVYRTFLVKVEKLCRKYDEIFYANFDQKNVITEKISEYFQGKKFDEFIKKYEDVAPLKLAEFFIRQFENFTNC